MTDFRALLSSLHRPRLLIRAARFGVAECRRDRDLRRLVGTSGAPNRLLPLLVAEEELLEEERRNGGAGYSVARHIDVLIALIAEVQLLPIVRLN